MDEQKQPDWLKVAIVTTIIGGVVQVVVNHFDNLLTFLGGAISHIQFPGSLSIILNIVSALATIGGASVTILVYRYRREVRKLRSAIRQIKKLVTEVLEQQPTLPTVIEAPISLPSPTPILPVNWEEVARQVDQEYMAAKQAQTPEAPPTQ